jgi:DNA-binding response OmpR family regulator
MRLLVVEDERKMAEALANGLRRSGYAVDLTHDGETALANARVYDYDAVVLDVMLPGRNGFDLCQALRSEHRWSPILMLTARDAVADRVHGLNVGADDYLAKPFAMRELLARIRAMLRRVEMMKSGGDHLAVLEHAAGSPRPGSVEPAALAVERPIAMGDLTVDRARRVATLDGRPVSLRPKEFDLLHFLVRHPGVVHSRDVLLRRVWGYDFSFGTRTVDVHVRWLRQKIERDPSQPTRLETVRGVGYRLVPHEIDGN